MFELDEAFHQTILKAAESECLGCDSADERSLPKNPLLRLAADLTGTPSISSTRH
ncbi:hypothetical protein PO124_20480 [Bacillus licheniformis]|nr:hypothetical protein [Bacillus licheniformis]